MTPQNVTHLEHADTHLDHTCITCAVLLLIAIGAANLAFWLIWPAVIITFQVQGYGSFAAGLFGSIAWIAMLGALAFSPRFVESYRPRNITMTGLVFVAVGALLSAFTNEIASQVIAAILIGAGTGLRWVAADFWITRVVPTHWQGRMLSLVEVVAGLTFAAGPILAALLPQQSAAMIAALLPLIAIILIAFVENPEIVKTISHAQGKIKTPVLLIMIAAAAFGGLHESGFAAIAALFSLDAGATGDRSLISAGAVGIGSFLAQYTLGSLADNRGGLAIMRLCAILVTIAITVLAIAPASLLAVSFVVGAFGGGLYTVAVIYGVQHAAQEQVSRMIAISGIAYVCGTLLAPPLIGLSLKVIGSQGSAILLAILTFALALWLFSRRYGGVEPHKIAKLRPSSLIT